MCVRERERTQHNRMLIMFKVSAFIKIFIFFGILGSNNLACLYFPYYACVEISTEKMQLIKMNFLVLSILLMSSCTIICPFINTALTLVLSGQRHLYFAFK
uniref:Uncharacterized protein n=1 Tax=Cacopsylla melanoneura TaxID=428564 RepID=A0A8D8VKL1_9HEMI